MDTIRRVRAARGSLNLSLDDFADAIGIGRQTLIRIENGSREPKPHEYEAMARVTGLPLEFFTTVDLSAALAGADQQPTLAKRVDELEAQVARLAGERQELLAEMARMAAAAVRRALESGDLPTG
jgi:transcriptional regulator with XRE-family HTH domain